MCIDATASGWSSTWPGADGSSGTTRCRRPPSARAGARSPSGWPGGQEAGSTSPRWGRRSGSPSGWSTSPEEVGPLAELGSTRLAPGFTVDQLGALLRGTSATLKTALTTQSLIAGVGNAYSDEALHRARLSPYKKTSNLDATEVAGLHAALVGVLTEAVERSAALDVAELKGDKKRAMQVHGRDR